MKTGENEHAPGWVAKLLARQSTKRDNAANHVFDHNRLAQYLGELVTQNARPISGAVPPDRCT